MSIIWKDGQFLDGSNPHVFHNDGGFSNGLSVFDSMLASDGILIDAKDHFDRLIHDARIVLHLSPPSLPVFEQITQAWLALLVKNKLNKGDARVKTIVTGGVTDRPLTVSAIPSVIISVTPSGSIENLAPLTCTIVTDFPRIAGSVLENCKRTDYTRAYAAKQEAIARGAEEAIITNTNGYVACASTSNVFIRENGKLFTPPLSDGVLAGITRKKILERGEAIEESISIERVITAQEIFLTNSFFGMRKVRLLA